MRLVYSPRAFRWRILLDGVAVACGVCGVVFVYTMGLGGEVQVTLPIFKITRYAFAVAPRGDAASGGFREHIYALGASG
jgi:hypothetical protein